MSLAELPPIHEEQNKYMILGVTQDATESDIHNGYRRMAFLYHPDRHGPEDQAAAQAAFQIVSDAFRILSVPETRALYDRALERGEPFTTDTPPPPPAVTLAEVLRSLEHAEQPDTNAAFKGARKILGELVDNNLIRQVGEHVLAVWPLKRAPAGAQIEGKFSIGAGVLTNLRLLLPYTSKWETRSGNTRTIHTKAYMQACLLPQTRRIEVTETGRLKRTVSIQFVQEEATLSFVTDVDNLAKVLIAARTWGIAVVAVNSSKSADRKLDRSWAIAPLRWFAYCLVAYPILGFLCNLIFNNDDPSSAIARVGRSLYPTAVWVLLLVAGWSVNRLRRWILIYRSEALDDLNWTAMHP